MRRLTRFIIIGLLLSLSIVGKSHAHSFSTSFLTVSGEQLLTYQISFHDLAVLNRHWIEEGGVSAGLLNSNLDKLSQFLNKTVSLGQCQLTLQHQRPWHTLTQAKQKYLVLNARSDCGESIRSVTINTVWAEFPDHRVIVEQGQGIRPMVLDRGKRTVTLR